MFNVKEEATKCFFAGTLRTSKRFEMATNQVSDYQPSVFFVDRGVASFDSNIFELVFVCVFLNNTFIRLRVDYILHITLALSSGVNVPLL